tara:strand:+ start:21758 stop:22810 length:1053 start_codon:yes stop_codon:yes gene_type:complete
MSYDVDGSILNFDTNKIPLLPIVLDYFGTNSINKIFENHKNDVIIEKLHKLERTKEFADCYRSLINILAIEFKKDDFYFQRIPSFRAHRIDQSSVNYHNDCMSGHGEKVINAWVPLIDTSEKNSLHLASHEDSIELLRKFQDEKLSLSEINKIFKKKSYPALTKYGELMLFNTYRIHGTEINSSNQNRISFDFRILPKGADPFTKTLNDYYISNLDDDRNKKDQIRCMYYVNMRNPLMKNCTHFVQRELMQVYANVNNLNAEGKEEPETYIVNHYPVIFYYLKTREYKHIVMASMLCLPNDNSLRNEVLLLANNNNVTLHFSLEKANSSNLSISQIEGYYENIVKAEQFL